MIIDAVSKMMGRPADSVTGPFMLRAGLGYEPGTFASWVPYFGVAISADGRRIVSIAVADDFDMTAVLLRALAEIAEVVNAPQLVPEAPGHVHVWRGVVRDPCDRCDEPGLDDGPITIRSLEPEEVFTLDPVCDFCDERHEGPCEPSTYTMKICGVNASGLFGDPFVCHRPIGHHGRHHAHPTAADEPGGRSWA